MTYCNVNSVDTVTESTTTTDTDTLSYCYEYTTVYVHRTRAAEAEDFAFFTLTPVPTANPAATPTSSPTTTTSTIFVNNCETTSLPDLDLRGMTNAERLKRGLPLNQPRFRKPGFLPNSRQEPSCITTVYVTTPTTTQTTTTTTTTFTEETVTCSLTIEETVYVTLEDARAGAAATRVDANDREISPAKITPGVSPPDVQHPPLMVSPSPLRPLTEHVKVDWNEPLGIEPTASGECTSLAYYKPLSSLNRSSYPDSKPNSQDLSAESTCTAIIGRVLIHPIPNQNVDQARLIDLKRIGAQTDCLSPIDTAQVLPTPDEIEELLPFTPGLPEKMKGWSNHLDETPSRIDSSQAQDLIDELQVKEDDEDTVQFDLETSGGQDSLQQLVEKTGRAALKKRNIS
ncbi:hypothetical protein L486_05013 [Kwoniella mangroviensis CBS 10435]|uniref:Uncharacterized protein n=1 Tax=Kwoniella mangroviensis CBS 10435 TaxID=1331196 RepID=A0A1B9IPQ1_9TREE|nr:hypothetical protein L486_05013 [Kwoniella mangroviensis CBS 10435]